MREIPAFKGEGEDERGRHEEFPIMFDGEIFYVFFS